MMKLKDIRDNAFHVVGGLAISLSIMWCYWLSIPALFVVGFLREHAQHRDEGFFGWITKHRMIEAATWGVGALVASIIWTFIKP